MGERVFVTGGTGFLGTEIIRELVRTTDKVIYVLVRAEDHERAVHRLTAAESETLHSPKLPQNLYLADATLFPQSMGNPPILTIMALARKIARRIKEIS